VKRLVAAGKLAAAATGAGTAAARSPMSSRRPVRQECVPRERGSVRAANSEDLRSDHRPWSWIARPPDHHAGQSGDRRLLPQRPWPELAQAEL